MADGRVKPVEDGTADDNRYAYRSNSQQARFFGTASTLLAVAD
jgi:hypothetical protein